MPAASAKASAAPIRIRFIESPHLLKQRASNPRDDELNGIPVSQAILTGIGGMVLMQLLRGRTTRSVYANGMCWCSRLGNSFNQTNAGDALRRQHRLILGMIEHKHVARCQ
jgi:hypothetical protein